MTKTLAFVATAIATVAISSLVVVTKARAHEAPTGWVYPSFCCKSAAESPTGDCAPIAAKYVTERPDGYHVNLPAGSHPQLKSQAYSAVIPYKLARLSEDGDYHICLSRDGANRFCFFAGPRLG